MDKQIDGIKKTQYVINKLLENNDLILENELILILRKYDLNSAVAIIKKDEKLISEFYLCGEELLQELGKTNLKNIVVDYVVQYCLNDINSPKEEVKNSIKQEKNKLCDLLKKIKK